MRLIIATICILFIAAACRKEEKDVAPQEQKINTIPEFYKPATEGEYGKNTPGFSLIIGASNSVAEPQDLDFNPLRSGELWIINKGTEGTGGSTVTVFNAGKSDQTSEYRQDGNAHHFMSLPTGIAFSDNGNWATSSGVLDANHSGGDFTGPALWSSDMDIYARPSGGNGSHLDMLHGSPYSMGIASETDNIFWVFDGYNGHLVRYDFVDDHGPGNDDHSDGKIHRYTEVSLKKTANPSHVVLDKKTGWLYIVDGGNKRILRVNINTGAKQQNLPLTNEPLAEHHQIGNVTWEVFTTDGFQEPVGIEIKDNRLFVSDHSNGDIIAYSTETKTEIGRISTGKSGVTGIVAGPDGNLWYTNQKTSEVIRIDPK